MSSGGGGGAAAAAAPAQQGGDWKSTLTRAVAGYFVVQALLGPNGLVSYYYGKTQFQKPPDDAAPSFVDGQSATAGTGAGKSFNVPGPRLPPGVSKLIKPHSVATPLALPGTPLDVYLFLSRGPPPTPEDLETQWSALVSHGRGAWADLTPHKDTLDLHRKDYDELLQDPVRQDLVNIFDPQSKDGLLPAARWSNVVVGDSKLARSVDLQIPVGPLVQTGNGSIWADIFAVPSGRPLRDLANAQALPTLRLRKLLTRLYPQRKHREQRKLFGASEQETEHTDAEKARALKLEDELASSGPAPLVTFWHRNLTLGLAALDAKSALPIGKLPPPVLQHVHVHHDEHGKPAWTGETEGQNALAKPLLFANDFWLLREHMNPINATVDTLPLTVNLYSTSFFKFQLITSMHDAFGKQEMGAAEVDLIKETLLTTSPWYLGVTMLVTLLHSLFEFLAFSSDVSHWRQKDNLAGVSIGSILTNVVVQLIILLYLIDQSEQTSWMILAGNGVGVLVEAWKLTKAVTVGIVPRKAENRRGPLGWLPYQLDVQNKRTPSEEELKTQRYDRQAFKICGLVMGPVLVGYTIYSALYEQHKGWWSFIIGTLCSFVYAFGFVSLIPQLLVNYNMKSVAGYPAKTMIYKILGTVVDDFFAFAIKMPWLHRLACFRDDVVFLIFLYQRYIYGVDESRVNEFGQIVSKKEEAKQVTAGQIKSESEGEGESKLKSKVKAKKESKKTQ